MVTRRKSSATWKEIDEKETPFLVVRQLKFIAVFLAIYFMIMVISV
jgi:hypothetical protein